MFAQNATASRPPIGIERWGTALAILPVAVGLVAIKAYGPLIRAVVEWRPDLVTAGVLAVAVLCAAFPFLRYPAAAGPARFLLTGLAIASGIYALALGGEIAVADPVRAAAVGHALPLGLALVVPATVLAIWRPSFAAFPFLYVVLHKDLTRSVSGATHLGMSDYLPLVEVGFFLAASLCALALLRVALLRWRPDHAPEDAVDVSWSATLVLVAAIGAHFGNYFLSGLAKVALDGGPLSWALENPTSSLMLAGYNLGTAPLSAWPWLFDLVHDAFSRVEVASNVVTLFAQLLCALAFLHRRLLLGVTVFFDAMHVGIFVLTGAMFVTWIVLNTLIVAAVMRLPEGRFRPSVMVLGFLVTVLGHQVFWNARLGWYDARQVRHGYFVAIDREGGEHRVPSNFFREASYLMLGRQFGFLEHTRPSAHVPTSAWGQIGIHVAPRDGATNGELMRQARRCAMPLPAAKEATPVAREATPAAPDYDEAAPARFIRGQHRRALDHAAAGTTNRYNIYPHHHLSMPFLFRDFEALDPRDIVAYRYVVESVCLDSTPSGLERRVLARTTSEIPLDAR